MPEAQDGDITQIRLLIPDTEPVFGADQNEYIFEDAEIAAVFEGVGKGSVLRTAGFLCNTVGNSEALILKVIQTQDLLTDGSKLQATWNAQGARYLAMADSEDALVDPSAQFYQVIDYRQGWNVYGNELTEWPHY